jgi:hypothetical protein
MTEEQLQQFIYEMSLPAGASSNMSMIGDSPPNMSMMVSPRPIEVGQHMFGLDFTNKAANILNSALDTGQQIARDQGKIRADEAARLMTQKEQNRRDAYGPGSFAISPRPEAYGPGSFAISPRPKDDGEAPLTPLSNDEIKGLLSPDSPTSISSIMGDVKDFLNNPTVAHVLKVLADPAAFTDERGLGAGIAEANKNVLEAKAEERKLQAELERQKLQAARQARRDELAEQAAKISQRRLELSEQAAKQLPAVRPLSSKQMTELVNIAKTIPEVDKYVSDRSSMYLWNKKPGYSEEMNKIVNEAYYISQTERMSFQDALKKVISGQEQPGKQTSARPNVTEMPG